MTHEPSQINAGAHVKITTYPDAADVHGMRYALIMRGRRLVAPGGERRLDVDHSGHRRAAFVFLQTGVRIGKPFRRGAGT